MELTLIRHGQASLTAKDYDQLSELGEQQSRALGSHFALLGAEFDHVVTGPLNRHEQTWLHIASQWSKPVTPKRLDALTEHEAVKVVDRELGDHHRLEGSADKATARAKFMQFDRVMRSWISGQVKNNEVESWDEACTRVATFLNELDEHFAHGDRVMLVTSGGFIAMAVGHVLNLSPIQIYELGLEVVNTSITQIRRYPNRLALTGFNAYPHLKDNITRV